MDEISEKSKELYGLTVAYLDQQRREHWESMIDKSSITLWVVSIRYENHIVGVYSSPEKALEAIQSYSKKEAEKISDDDDVVLMYRAGFEDFLVEDCYLDEIPVF